MRARFVEHSLSIVLVTLVFLVFVLMLREEQSAQRDERTKALAPYLALEFLNLGNPLHKALLKETLYIFHPDTRARNDSLLRAIEAFREEQFTSQAYKAGLHEQGLTIQTLERLGPMYLKFILIYLVVIVVSYRAAQSLAIFRFVKRKQNKGSYLIELYESMKNASLRKRGISFYGATGFIIAKSIAKGFAYAVLFAPAYVIAYSIRTRFDTDSYLFMVVLGVVSNGLLINYANKFFTFLTTESRKGYVDTAIVKGLSASYAWGTPDGVPRLAVIRPGSLFDKSSATVSDEDPAERRRPAHVFRHIYLNARHQYIPALKEHASFLITGLVIIEMALNIQGHLGYELMQRILYRQYDVAAAVILGIFLVVKATEIVVDMWFHRESRKYENRAKRV